MLGTGVGSQHVFDGSLEFGEIVLDPDFRNHARERPCKAGRLEPAEVEAR